MATQTTPEPQPVSFAFPFRAANGKALVDEHAFYDWLSSEDSGSFAVSSAGMWHGGIHVSADGAGRQLDLAHGVRCIAGGEIVAYRTNWAALTSEIPKGSKSGQTGHFSSAFTLVRHTLEYPANNRLTFFSLYMHLQSVAEYTQRAMPAPAYWARCHEVAPHAADRPKATAHTPVPADHIGLNIRAEAKGTSQILGILPCGTQVRIGERRNKGLWGKIEAIESGSIIPPEVSGAVRPGAHTGWVYLGKERGRIVLAPVVSRAQSDQVIVPEKPIPINAGDLIGHLGQYWLPSNPAQSHQMVHIEVFCGSDLHGFLAKTRAAAKDITDFNKLPLLRIGQGVKLFQVKKTNAQGQPAYEEGANAPQTAVVQIYSQAALDALPAEHKGPKDNEPAPGQPWWCVTSANGRHEDITGWVRNRQMPPNGGVTRESPHAWVDFETVTGADAGNPTIFSTVDAYLDHVLCEDKPATGSVEKLKPLACNAYRALSPMRNEAHAADEMRSLKKDKWLRLRASRLIPKHRSEWASQTQYQSFFDTVLQRIAKEPYHDAEIERLKQLVWWDDVKKAVKGPFPDSADVFHIHPIALVGNFVGATTTASEGALICKKCGKDITLTKNFLNKIAPGASAEFIDELVRSSSELFSKYDINSCRQVKHLLAQAKHETQRFKKFRESLYYASYTGQTLYNMAPTVINKGFHRKGITFSSPAEKIAWIQNHLIANDAAYGEHCFGTNEQPGKDFRGRGLLHLTHYDTYKACASEIGYPIDSQPELVETSQKVIIKTGLWFWWKNRIGLIADDPTTTGDPGVRKVTYPINSGYKGLDERQQFKREISLIFNQHFLSGCTDD